MLAGTIMGSSLLENTILLLQLTQSSHPESKAQPFIKKAAAELLANEAQTSQPQIKYKEGIDSDGHPILDHPATAKNADASSDGPRDKNDIDRYPRNPMKL